MKYLEKIQGLLPLGYLYLILLGLLKESLLYYPLGINIVDYSSITDILISPISDMTSNPILIIITVVVIIVFFIIQTILVQNSHTKWAKKVLGENRFSNETSKRDIQKALLPVFILFVAFELLAIFIGMGLGRGREIVKKINNNELHYHHKAIFNSGKPENIHIIGINSSYCFYVSQGNKNVKIAPVGTINNLELLKQKNNDKK